ncbi:MAG: hypothetical protein WDM96_03890 [Lacunisphaera sp.]
MKKDESQAARWYKQAADRGFAQAQYNLGLLTEDGRGVAKDPAAAAALYRAAAQQGLLPHRSTTVSPCRKAGTAPHRTRCRVSCGSVAPSRTARSRRPAMRPRLASVPNNWLQPMES